MASVDVKDLTGKKAGSVDLPEEWFGAEPNLPVVHQVVTAQLSAARQGTHQTKTRAQVAGGGRKPYRQKGTGRARQGSIRSPQFVGGGVAHGRTPSDWTKRVNKKMRKVALRSVLSERAGKNLVTVVRGLQFETPRTRDAVAALTALGHADVKTLVVLADLDVPTMRSLRNLPKVHTLVVDQLNTHDVLTADVLVFHEDALGLIGTGRRASSTTEEASA